MPPVAGRGPRASTRGSRSARLRWPASPSWSAGARCWAEASAPPWPGTTAASPEALAAWADGAFTLANVNAGPGCSAAPVPHDRDGSRRPESLVRLAEAAAAAAEICRKAGAAAARACLDARLALAGRPAAAGQPEAPWWRGLVRLAQDAPGAVTAAAAIERAHHRRMRHRGVRSLRGSRAAGRRQDAGASGGLLPARGPRSAARARPPVRPGHVFDDPDPARRLCGSPLGTERAVARSRGSSRRTTGPAGRDLVRDRARAGPPEGRIQPHGAAALRGCGGACDGPSRPRRPTLRTGWPEAASDRPRRARRRRQDRGAGHAALPGPVPPLGTVPHGRTLGAEDRARHPGPHRPRSVRPGLSRTTMGSSRRPGPCSRPSRISATPGSRGASAGCSATTSARCGSSSTPSSM